MLTTALRYLHTLRHLRMVQVVYRIYYLIRKKSSRNKKINVQKSPVGLPAFKLGHGIPSYRSYDGETFTFTGISHRFDNSIDWNFALHGKLWTYNLNYFDFLNQDGLQPEEGIRLMEDFCRKLTTASIGLEPFPTSIRGINWIKFILKHGISNHEIIDSLFTQYRFLANSIEYHLLGNHLLENAFSLFYAGLFFRDKRFAEKAGKILTKELEVQILADGAHFELSPMYHQAILQRLLDCINMHRSTGKPDNFLENLFSAKANAMLGWLNSVTFKNGAIPMVNDAVPGISASTDQLNSYAQSLGFSFSVNRATPLSQSGYRKFTFARYECFLDAGNIGPDYIPGHAHSDTFSFELYVDQNPVIVDSGTSTYENNPQRHLERSTRSHNTVTFNNLEQSDTWASHRVGRRAKVQICEESPSTLVARHDGFRNWNVAHQRSFRFSASEIVITDLMTGAGNKDSTAFLHFFPGIMPVILENMIITPALTIKLEGHSRVSVSEYNFAMGFNQLVGAWMAEITFTSELTTTITL